MTGRHAHRYDPSVLLIRAGLAVVAIMVVVGVTAFLLSARYGY